MTTPNPNPTPRAPHEYIPGYKPTHIAIHSWRTAENSAAHLLPTLRHLATTNPHLQLLDCGCGPGTITASLAKYMPPTGHITATDISPDVLAMARATARAAGVAPHALSHVPADVHALPFPDAHFDVVHAQQLLCHLARPRDALREMWRVVRPGGGVLALKECDLGSWTVWPALTGCVETGTATVRAMEVGGGSGDLGRRLLGLCLDGLEGVRREDVVLSMGTWCYSTREEREMWGNTFATRLREGGLRRKVIEQNLGWTEAEMDAMAEDWERWIEAEDGVMSCMHGEVIVTKP